MVLSFRFYIAQLVLFSLKLVFVLIGWISTYVFRFVCYSHMLMFSRAAQL